MHVDIVTEAVIHRSRSEVSAFSSDPSHVPEWYVNIKSVEWRTEPPLRAGSRIAFVAHFLWQRLAYTYEVVEWVPGERFVMRTSEGPFPMETTYTWRTTADGHTEMSLRNLGEPSGFSRWMAPLMSLAIRRANRKDLAKLKSILEGGAVAPVG